MKSSSTRSMILLCLPAAFILVFGILVSGYRERERKERIAYYSQPYKSQLQVEYADMPKFAGAFEVKAHGISTGGSRQSHWWFRGQLFDMSGRTPREIWNSQKSAQSLSYIMGYPGGISCGGPTQNADFSWRFSRDTKDKRQLKFIVEAVAIPIVVPEEELGGCKMSINEGKPFQIAWAKQQPNAKYFCESIELKASDDFKHQMQNPRRWRPREAELTRVARLLPGATLRRLLGSAKD